MTFEGESVVVQWLALFTHSKKASLWLTGDLSRVSPTSCPVLLLILPINKTVPYIFARNCAIFTLCLFVWMSQYVNSECKIFALYKDLKNSPNGMKNMLNEKNEKYVVDAKFTVVQQWWRKCWWLISSQNLNLLLTVGKLMSDYYLGSSECVIKGMSWYTGRVNYQFCDIS